MIARPTIDAPLFATDSHTRPSDRGRLKGQNARILARLREGPLTCTEALAMGCRRLAARIYDLKQHGYLVLTTPLAGGDCLYSLIG